MLYDYRQVLSPFDKSAALCGQELLQANILVYFAYKEFNIGERFHIIIIYVFAVAYFE